jgi:hypothetical protein
VAVVDNGFLWSGKTHLSLSSIARAVTGTNWNGPRFFGMREPTKHPGGGTWSLTSANSSVARFTPGSRHPRRIGEAKLWWGLGLRITGCTSDGRRYRHRRSDDLAARRQRLSRSGHAGIE